MVNDLEVKSVIFPHFGKNIPKSAKLSPDAFIQIALQVAFHRMHGNLPPTYETGTLRRFAEI
jgi:carnitine O-acetyltransferase